MQFKGNYEDYIEFCSYKKDISEAYLIYESQYIVFRSNDISYIDQVYDSRYISKVKEKDYPICGYVTVLIDENIFPYRYDMDTYDDNHPTSKTHPMYIEGVTNTFFEYGEKITHIFHYPNESINIFDKNQEEYFSLVSNTKDAIKFSVNGIKMIAGSINLKRKIYSMHSSAVSFKGKGYVFLGGSHSGKTSIYINLLCKCFLPINDDVVFWRVKDEAIVLSSLPTVFNLRNQKSSEIKMTDDYIQLKNMAKEYSVFSKNNYSTNVELDAVFVPEFGYEETVVSKISPKDVLKKIARACTSHGFLEVTDDFHKNFNQLLQCEFYSLKMSNDYNDVCSHIIEIIKERV